jgi:hypothetical protein
MPRGSYPAQQGFFSIYPIPCFKEKKRKEKKTMNRWMSTCILCIVAIVFALGLQLYATKGFALVRHDKEGMVPAKVAPAFCPSTLFRRDGKYVLEMGQQEEEGKEQEEEEEKKEGKEQEERKEGKEGKEIVFDTFDDYIDHDRYDKEPYWIKRIDLSLSVLDGIYKDIPAIFAATKKRRQRNRQYLASQELNDLLLKDILKSLETKFEKIKNG